MAILDESQAVNLLLPDARAGSKARATSINGSGGLGGSGHPVDVTYCVTNFSQSGADACVHQAASDPSYVAIVGSVSGMNISSGLQAAGLAEIDAVPLDVSALQNPISFPNNPGPLSTAAAAVVGLRDLHMTKMSILEIGAPQATVLTSITNSILASWKAAPLVKAVTIPIGASDVSSQLTTAAQGVQGMITAVLPAVEQQLFVARSQLGLSVPIITSNAYWTAESLKSTPAADGASGFSTYPTSDIAVPGNTAFAKDMTAIGDASQVNVSDQAKAAWISFDMLSTACKGLTTITKATVLNAMNHLTDYTAGGLTATIDFTKPGPNPNYNRVRNFSYFWDKVSNGKFVSAGKGKLEPMFGNG
jgi:hypothetical protein